MSVPPSALRGAVRRLVPRRAAPSAPSAPAGVAPVEPQDPPRVSALVQAQHRSAPVPRGAPYGRLPSGHHPQEHLAPHPFIRIAKLVPRRFFFFARHLVSQCTVSPTLLCSWEIVLDRFQPKACRADKLELQLAIEQEARREAEQVTGANAAPAGRTAYAREPWLYKRSPHQRRATITRRVLAAWFQAACAAKRAKRFAEAECDHYRRLAQELEQQLRAATAGAPRHLSPARELTLDRNLGFHARLILCFLSGPSAFGGLTRFRSLMGFGGHSTIGSSIVGHGHELTSMMAGHHEDEFEDESADEEEGEDDEQDDVAAAAAAAADEEDDEGEVGFIGFGGDAAEGGSNGGGSDDGAGNIAMDGDE